MNANLGQVEWSNPVDMDHPLNRGLVSWWMAGEGPFWGGPLFRDLVPISSRGGGNHGTLTNGPTWGGAMGSPGEYGSILLNTGNGVRLSSDSALDPDSYPKTYSTLVMTTNAGANSYWWSSHNAWDANVRIWLGIHGGAFVGRTGGSGGSLNVISGGIPASNVWYHFCLVLPSSTSGTLYINAQSVASSSSLNWFAPVNGLTKLIGGSENNAEFQGSWIGYVNDVRVFNAAKSETDVVAIYNDSRLGYPQTLNRLRTPTIFDMGGGAAATYSQYWWNTSYDYSGLGV